MSGPPDTPPRGPARRDPTWNWTEGDEPTGGGPVGGGRPGGEPAVGRPPGGEPVGEDARGLSFVLGYGRREFRLDVELRVPVGVTALFGPSGSGKSTLLRCLAGLLRPSHGRIELDGRVLYSSVDGIDLPPEARRLGYVPQEGLLFPHLSLRRNIYYGLPRDGSGAPEETRKRAEELIDLLGLRALLDRRPGEVSYGEAQRAALLRALVIGPQALLMDEPLSALDRALKARALSDLREMKGRPSLRIPVLYVTHDAAEVLALADRVLLIRDGRVVGAGGPELAIHPPGGFPEGGADNLITGRLLPGPHADAGFSVAWGPYRLKVSGRVPGAAQGLSPAGGERITLAFSPTEAIVSLQPPGATSARNVLPAVIADAVPAGGVALLRFDEPERFHVAVTADAREDLDLRPGRSVFLLIKSTSLRPIELRRA